MKRQRSYLVINLWTFNELLIAKTLRDGVEIRNNIELIKLIALCWGGLDEFRVMGGGNRKGLQHSFVLPLYLLKIGFFEFRTLWPVLLHFLLISITFSTV